MRTRSTCVALSLAAICTMSFTITGCSSDSPLPLEATSGSVDVAGQSPSSLSEQTAWMGKYHNDALEFALKRIKASRTRSKRDRCRVGVAALKDFQKAYAKNGRSPVFLDVSLSDGACEAAEASLSGHVASRSLMASIGTGTEISPLAGDYMNQIVSQVDYASSALTLSFAVNRIVNQASSTIAALEATAVAGAGSITTSSATYWESNESAWQDPNQIQYNQLSDGIEGFTNKPVNISARTKAIIKADAVAGVSTLLSQWFMGEAALAAACIRAAAASLAAGVFAT
jgi:hypothetical protein